MSWERWRIRAVTGGLLTALAVAGCAGKSTRGDDDDDDGNGDSSSGPSCTSVCDEARACPGADTIVCATYCAKIESLAESAGCSAELATYLECFDGVADKCPSTNTTCEGEVTDFYTCLTPYCADHAAECTLE